MCKLTRVEVLNLAKPINLSRADLKGIDLSEADLTEANLTGTGVCCLEAILEGAIK